MQLKGENMFNAIRNIFGQSDAQQHNRIIAIDCETTGLSPEAGDRIVSLGLVKANAELLPEDGLYLVFNPEKKSNWQAEKVHGLNTWYLKHQPLFAEYADEICSYIENAILIGHNIQFDIGFLNKELISAGKSPIRNPTQCTMMLAEHRFGRRLSLVDLTAQYGADLNDLRLNDIHNAYDDACVALGLYSALTKGEAKIRTFNPIPDNERPVPEILGPSDTSRKAMIERGKALTGTQAYLAYEKYGCTKISSQALGVSAAQLRRALGEYHDGRSQPK